MVSICSFVSTLSLTKKKIATMKRSAVFYEQVTLILVVESFFDLHELEHTNNGLITLYPPPTFGLKF